MIAVALSSLPAERRPSCAILVPSYRRSTDLSRCLAALHAQRVLPDQVIVVLRAEDTAARAVVSSAGAGIAFTEILSDRPGQVAALNAGLGAVHCDITAITDDDAVPHPEWLARILEHFADPTVAAVGGRDAVVGATDGRHPVVGLVGWHGRMIGNHHRGTGSVRRVDILKGANMAFRTAWLRRFGFDERLRGIGAQVHNDLMVCLQIRRAGGVVLYDPEVLVDHYPAQRPAGDDRTHATLAAVSDAVHNETLALMEFLPVGRRSLWLLWTCLLGTWRRPGLGVSLALLPSRRWDAVYSLMACWRGRVAGVLTWRATRMRT